MGIGGQLRPQDRDKFAAAARKFGVWILVRGTNPKSLPYIGRPEFTPKPIDCKAKTAQEGPNAGLVVDPTVATNAFPPARLIELQNSWKSKDNPLKFSARAGRYSVEQSGPRRGCVKLDGKYIYGDYDLKAVVVPGHESATVALVTELWGVNNARQGPFFTQIQRELNLAIGADMVQHGADDEFAAHADESIFVFGPSGEYRELHGTAEIQQWYSNEFKGRKTADSKATGGIPAGVQPGIRGVVQPDGTIRPVTFGKR